MKRSLSVAIAALLLLCFNVSYGQSWEPVCDVSLTCIQDFAEVQTGGFGTIPNLTPFEFTTAPWGASGQQADNCARSSNTLTSFLSFEHEGLSSEYEYRITVNAKSKFENKSLFFAFGTSAGVSGATNIGGGHLVPVLLPNQPGEDISSEVFTLPNPGTYFITFFPRGSGEGNRVFLDNYILERRLIIQPTVSFSSASSTIDDGEVLSLCIDLLNLPEGINEEVEISLESATDPHFTDFTTQSLTINESTESQICISVPSRHSGQSGMYEFTLNTQVGSALQIGNHETVEVTVNETNPSDQCNWAGPDVHVCRGDEGIVIGFDPTQADDALCWDDYCVKWLPEEGLDDPYALNPVATPVETTTYTIHVTDNDGVYYGSDEVVVVVIANPQPIITPATPYVCGEGEVSLVGSIAGGFSEYNIVWAPTNENTSSITVADSGTYSLQVTNEETGCEAQASVTVIESELEAFVTSEYDQICAEGELLLVPQMEGSDGPFSYQWSNGVIEENLIIDQSGEYRLTITDDVTGCKAYASINIPSYEPSVEMLGALFDGDNTEEDLSILPDHQIVCPNSSFDLGVSGEFTSVAWSSTGDLENLVIDGDGSSALYTASGDETSVTITVTVVLEDGCTATDEVNFNNAELDHEAAQAFIDELGFYCIDITILGEVTLTNSDPQRSVTSTPCDGGNCTEEDVVCVRDDARLRIAIEGEEVDDLQVLANEYLDYFMSEFEYPSARAYIIYEGDACTCADGGNYLEEIKNDFEEDELAFWFVITGENEPNSPGKLCVLTNVPTSAEHYPAISDEKEAFVEFSLQVVGEDEDDGGLGSEANQKIFTLFDATTDSWLGYAPPEPVDPGEDAILCAGALSASPWVISPSGIPMQMPTITALSWIYPSPWSLTVADGTLAGFTYWEEEDDGVARPHYFGARINQADLVNGVPIYQRFIGYQRYGTKRDVYVGGIYTSPVLEIPGEGNMPPTFSTGVPDDDFFPTSIELASSKPRIPVFIENGFIQDSGSTSSTDGSGPPFVADVLVGTDDHLLLEPISEGIELSLPIQEIVDVTFSDVREVLNNVDASVFALQHENENGNIIYSYVLAFFNELDELELRLYNCYSGSYDIPVSHDLIPSVMIQTIAGYTLGNQFDDQDLEAEVVGLGRPFFIELTEEQADALNLTYSPNQQIIGAEISTTDQVANYAFANEADLQMFVDEAARGLRMGEARVHTQFIISADDKRFIDPSTEQPINIDGEAAARNFLEGEMSRDDGEFDTPSDLPDAKLYVHHKADGGAILGLRFAEDFFVKTQITTDDGTVVTELPVEEATKIQNMGFQTWEQALLLQANSGALNQGTEGCDVLEDCPEDSNEDRRPWFIGKRPNTAEWGVANMTGEMLAIGADFAKDGQLSEAFVMSSIEGQTIEFMMEGPEAPCAFANQAAGANPFVGAYQLATFGWSVFTEEQVREGLTQAFSDPAKLARAMYEDKKDAYFGDNEEKRLWASGNDIGAIFSFFLGGGGTTLSKLHNKIRSLGKKADDSARRMADDLPVNPRDAEGIGSYFDEMADAFRRSDDNPLDGFTPEEVDGFWNDFMGVNFGNEPIHARKIMANPYLAKWWKRFKDSGDLCPFNFTTPPPIGFTGGVGGDYALVESGITRWNNFVYSLVTECADFDDFIRQLPEPPSTDFYSRLKATFPDTPEGMDKAGMFIDDAKDYPGTFLLIRSNPRLIEVWAILPDVLRRNADNLNKVYLFEIVSPSSLQQIGSELVLLPVDRHQRFINGLGNVSNNSELSASLTLNIIPEVQEVANAANRIKQHRIDVGIEINKNFGYLEGNFQGGSISYPNSDIVSSGSAVPPNQQIFEAVDVGGWERYTDSEYKMLNQLAIDLGAQPGIPHVNPNVTGTITIVSERPYCVSCQGVIQQFNSMFPGIEIKLIDGVR